jgi:glutamine synthetase
MTYNLETPEDALRTIKDDKIAMINLRLADVPGLRRRFSVPPRALDSDGFEGGAARTHTGCVAKW